MTAMKMSGKSVLVLQLQLIQANVKKLNMFSMPTTFLSLVALSLGLQCVLAQVVVNGQIFTNGLAIVDAPQPGT